MEVKGAIEGEDSKAADCSAVLRFSTVFFFYCIPIGFIFGVAVYFRLEPVGRG